jgi:hypothetical protein
MVDGTCNDTTTTSTTTTTTTITCTPQDISLAKTSMISIVILMMGLGSIVLGLIANLPYVMAPVTVMLIFLNDFLRKYGSSSLDLDLSLMAAGVIVSGIIIAIITTNIITVTTSIIIITNTLIILNTITTTIIIIIIIIINITIITRVYITNVSIKGTGYLREQADTNAY